MYDVPIACVLASYQGKEQGTDSHAAVSFHND